MKNSLYKNDTLAPAHKAGQAATMISVTRRPQTLPMAVLRTAGSRALITAAATAAVLATGGLMTGQAIRLGFRDIWTEGP